MTESKLNPLAIAAQEIPTKWYESVLEFSKWHRRSFLLYTSFYVLSAAIAIRSGSYSLYPHFIAAGLSILSQVADGVSTVKAIDAAEEAKKRKLIPYFREIDPAFSHVQTSSELTHNPRFYLQAVKECVWSSILPFYGFPQAGGHVVGALNNFRAARRLNLANEIARG